MDPDPQIPQKLKSIISSELSSGEQVTWSAQPLPWRRAWEGIPAVLLGLPLTAAAIWWTAYMWNLTPRTGDMVWADGSLERSGWLPILLFLAVGTLFNLAGLGIVSVPYWMGRCARRTAYVLTDRRAMIVSRRGYGNLTIRSFPLDRITHLQRKENRDGSGDLLFSHGGCGSTGTDASPRENGFMAILDVRSLETQFNGLLAQRLLRRARARPDRSI